MGPILDYKYFLHDNKSGTLFWKVVAGLLRKTKWIVEGLRALCIKNPMFFGI